MSALASSGGLEVYRERLSSFHEIEDFTGEVAELLAHVADALSRHPGDVDLSPAAPPNLNCLSLQEQDWPSFTRLQSLLQTWRERKNELLNAWTKLSDQERVEAGPLPPFGAADPSRPLV